MIKLEKFALLRAFPLPASRNSFMAKAPSSRLALLGRTSLLLVVGVGFCVAQGDPNTIPSLIKQAKRSHLDHISLPAPMVLRGDPKTLEIAVDNSSVLIAQLIARVTTHSDLYLMTWNKFRLIEMLHRQPKPLNEEVPSDIAPALLPIQPGEFVMATGTGSEVIDGVTVSVSDPAASELTVSNDYVLFVTFRSQDVASMTFGTSGVFLLDPNGLMTPIRDMGQNKLATTLRRRHMNGMSEFRSFVGSRK